MSLPHNTYPASSDTEEMPSPLFSMPKGMQGSVTGVSSNHSSTSRSAGTEGVQYRDADDNGGSAGHLDPAGDDPNISGTLPTAQLHDWQAGRLNAWAENDDYRQFFEYPQVPESRLCCYSSVHDGDYDDNGGQVSMKPDHAMHSDQEFGTDETAPLSNWGEGVIRR